MIVAILVPDIEIEDAGPAAFTGSLPPLQGRVWAAAICQFYAISGAPLAAPRRRPRAPRRP